MSVTTALHISFGRTDKKKRRHHAGAVPTSPKPSAQSLSASQCIRIDDSGKRVYVGRGEVSFAHRQCSAFDFDHIGISPQHSSTFLHVVAPMVYDLVEHAMPAAPTADGSHTLHRRTGAAQPPHHRVTLFTAQTCIVYGHSHTDRLDLYRYLADKITEAASQQVRIKNLQLANEGSSHEPLELSFSLVDTFHTWGIADVLDPTSFLHDVNGMRTLNAMKRSNGSKGLPFVMPTRRSIATADSSVRDDVAEVGSSLELLSGLRILYRQAELQDHKESSSAVLSIFCSSSDRSSALHLVMLPEADAPSSTNRVGSQLSAVSTTLQLLQHLTKHHPQHGAEDLSAGGNRSSSLVSQQTSHLTDVAGSSTRIPMRESPILMYLMQTEEYYQCERAARHQVAQHNRLLDVELSRVNSEASFSRKHIPSTTPRRSAAHLAHNGGSANGFPALPSAAIAVRSLGHVALIVSINCAVENYSHVLSACHFAHRSKRHHSGNGSGEHMEDSTVWQQSSVESSPSRSFDRHSRYHREAMIHTSAPTVGVATSPEAVSSTSTARHFEQHQHHNASSLSGNEDAQVFAATAAFGSHEPSMISHDVQNIASREATDVGSPSRPDEHDDGEGASTEETSVERAFRQVVHAAVHFDAPSVPLLSTQHRSPQRDASTMVVLSPATPASTQTDTPLASAQQQHASMTIYSEAVTKPAVARSTVATQLYADPVALDGPLAHNAATTSVRNTTATTQTGGDERLDWRSAHQPLPPVATPATTTTTTGAEQLADHLPLTADDAHAETRSPSSDCDDETAALEQLAANISVMGKICDTRDDAAGANINATGYHQHAHYQHGDTNDRQSLHGDGASSADVAFEFEVPDMDDFVSRSQSVAPSVTGHGGANDGRHMSSKSSVSSRHREEVAVVVQGGSKQQADYGVKRTASRSPSPRSPTRTSVSQHNQRGEQLAGHSMSHAMLVEKLCIERDHLFASIKKLEFELASFKNENEHLQRGVTDRDDHIKSLSSKLEDLKNHRQHVSNELVASHNVQQSFFKRQLDEAMVRHEETTRSMQATILTLSKEKLALERELVSSRSSGSEASENAATIEMLKNHVDVLHTQIDALHRRYDKQHEDLSNEILVWRRKAEESAHEMMTLRRSLDERDAAANLRKVDEALRIDLVVEQRVRDALQSQTDALDAERKARLAAEHEAFQLRLQTKDLMSRLIFFEEQVAPEVDLSIKELEEQMQQVHQRRMKFQKTLHTTLSRTSSASNSPAAAAGSMVASGDEESLSGITPSTRLFP